MRAHANLSLRRAHVQSCRKCCVPPHMREVHAVIFYGIRGGHDSDGENKAAYAALQTTNLLSYEENHQPCFAVLFFFFICPRDTQLNLGAAVCNISYFFNMIYSITSKKYKRVVVINTTQYIYEIEITHSVDVQEYSISQTIAYNDTKRKRKQTMAYGTRAVAQRE